jgi:hypothetical protein
MSECRSDAPLEWRQQASDPLSGPARGGGANTIHWSFGRFVAATNKMDATMLW